VKRQNSDKVSVIWLAARSEILCALCVVGAFAVNVFKGRFTDAKQRFAGISRRLSLLSVEADTSV